MSFYNYDLLSGADTKLFSSLSDDEACLRKGTPVFKLAMPFDWSQDPYKDPNWCFQLHCWRMGDKWLREYFETGRFDALRRTIPIVEDWYRFHFTEHRSSEYSWYDMSVGIRAARIAFYLSMINEAKGEFDADELRRMAFLLEELARAHVSFLTKDKNLHKGNHGIFQLHGLALLASCLQDNQAMEYASDRFDGIMGAQFTERGLHTENSPEYHFFVMNMIEKLKLDELFSQSLPSQVLERANNIKDWLAMPDSRLATFGDTSSRFKWIKAVRSRVSIKVGDAEYFVKDMSDDGLLVVRNNNETPEYFATTFGGHSYVHKHADVGQIILWHKGALFLGDPGKYTYGKSEDRDKVVSAISHGVIDTYPETLHPTDIRLPDSGTYKTGISFLEDRLSLFLTFFNRSGSAFARHVTYHPGRKVIIRDVAYKDQGVYASRLKFNGELTVEERDGCYILTEPTLEASISLRTPDGAELTYPDFGLSKEYGKLDPAWVFEAVAEVGDFLGWEIDFL
ncbi:heparinase II/III family protein [Limimaricola cinnabarinus]|uniref:heparinase II/III family protein n=1 Tax=Limimaricola cinnabarinus TaxID=1125964 RepID=UPI002FE2951D